MSIELSVSVIITLCTQQIAIVNCNSASLELPKGAKLPKHTWDHSHQPFAGVELSDERNLLLALTDILDPAQLQALAQKLRRGHGFVGFYSTYAFQ